jgi:hypothetical protein
MKNDRGYGPGLMAPAMLLMVALAIGAEFIPTGCASYGSLTFNEKFAAGLSADTSVLQVTTTLKQSDKISATDAKNIEVQADNLKSALDIAYQMHETDPTAGATKLDTTLTALKALQTYLATRGKP